METQRGISRTRNLRRIGQTVEVLIEGTDDARAYGRSYAEAPDVDGKVILTNAASIPAGTFVSAQLTRAEEYDMIGERV